jgi:UDP-glucuronate 4-epimerase
MAKYFLTGAAGFIASRVAELLLDRGDEVVGIDNLNDAYDPRLKHWRLEQLKSRDGFEFVGGDIEDRESLARVFGSHRFDGVINLAARAGVRQSVADPWVYISTNTTGTLNLLDLCRKHDVPKFLLASTSSLYGTHNPQPFSEDADTSRPLSPYASSKKAAEAMCYTYHYLYGIDVTVYRFFTVYGPAGRPDMSLFRFIQWVNEGKPVLIFGDGTQSRDFTYVDDIARGTVAGLKPLGYEVINLGSDTPVVLNDALRMVEEALGKSAEVRYEPMHRADVPATWANISKARRLLDWEPQTTPRQGIQNSVDWYLANRDWAGKIKT